MHRVGRAVEMAMNSVMTVMTVITVITVIRLNLT